MQGEKKKKMWTRTRSTFLPWNVRLRSFWKFQVVVVQKNGKEMNKKSVLHVQSRFFLLIRPIAVFHRSPALPSPLSITQFYILFEQTINIIESFAFSRG